MCLCVSLSSIKNKVSRNVVNILNLKDFSSVAETEFAALKFVALLSCAICCERSYKRSYCARDLREESKDQSSKDDNDA